MPEPRARRAPEPGGPHGRDPVARRGRPAPPRHPAGGRSGFALVDDRQVHYLEWGHRGLPSVLALHGGGQTAYMFEDLGEAVAGRYHVLAPDLPSHGDSDPMEERLGPTAIATTIPALLDAFGMPRVVLVGAPLGGLTGIRLGAEHPDRVAGLVLIDVGHRLEPEGVRKIVDFMGPTSRSARSRRPPRRSRSTCPSARPSAPRA